MALLARRSAHESVHVALLEFRLAPYLLSSRVSVDSGHEPVDREDWPGLKMHMADVGDFEV